MNQAYRVLNLVSSFLHRNRGADRPRSVPSHARKRLLQAPAAGEHGWVDCFVDAPSLATF
jgi:hypothetical protein